jgi:signal transduction histidine kinase
MKKAAAITFGVCMAFSAIAQDIVSASFEGLHKKLTSAKTIVQKTDCWFWLSWRHSGNFKFDSSRFYLAKIKTASESARYMPGLGKYYLAKGRMEFLNSGFAESESDIIQAISIFTKYPDDLYLGMAHKQNAYNYVGGIGGKRNVPMMRHHFFIALDHLSKLPANRELVVTYYELGRSFLDTYQVDSSALYLISAQRLAEITGTKSYGFNVNYMLGKLYISLNEWDKAIVCLKYALGLLPWNDLDKVMLRNCLAEYIVCLIEKKQFSTAAELIAKYEAVNIKLADDFGYAMTHHIKGSFEFAQGNFEAATRYYSTAYTEFKKINRANVEAMDITFRLATARMATGDTVTAFHDLWEVVSRAGYVQSGLYKMKAYNELSKAYRTRGDIDSAHYCFQQYAAYKDSLLSFQKHKAVLETIAQYEIDKKEQQIKLLQNETDLYSLQLRLKTGEIEKQKMLSLEKLQQLDLMTRQNEINRLTASEKTLALENQRKETARSQKEKELQADIAARESQRKNYAYIAIAAVLLFGGYAFVRYVQHKRMSKRLAASLAELRQTQEQLIMIEKEKEAENIRSTISRDIHDEVGSTLSGVALYSEIAKQKMKEHNEADVSAYLEHISANSKEMVQKMSDIVWAINPENDSFGRIMSKLQAMAMNLCAGKNIRLHTNIDKDILDDHPEMKARKNLYLFLKEALNNAVKYSGGKNLFFSLKKVDEKIIAEIKDDGKGFDRQTYGSGNGLNNMRIRARELNGQFTLDSAPGKGTRVRLEFNFHPAGGHHKVV